MTSTSSALEVFLWVVVMTIVMTTMCTACGLTLMYDACSERLDQDLMLDKGQSRLAEALITGKRTGSYRKCETLITTYLVSYEFEFERQPDGARCKVEVRDRHYPEHLFVKLSQGSLVDVRYLVDDPRHCRLEPSMEYEKFHGVRCCLYATGSALCTLLGLSLPYQMLMFGAKKGNWLSLVFVVLWCLVAGCMLWSCVMDTRRGRYWCLGAVGTHPTEGSSVRQLEWPPASGALGDLSGTWLVESHAGGFEYRLVMEGSTDDTVTVIGKAVGDSNFAPPCRGHFITRGGKELLRWQDSEGAVFTVDFSDRGSFAGSARAPMGQDHQLLSFTGRRQ